MKKYISIFAVVVALIGLTGVFYSFKNTEVGNEKAMIIAEDVGVKFGRGPSCDGPRGACSVSGGDGSSKMGASDAKASFLLDESNRLIMRIIKASIAEDDMELQFNEDYFEFDKSIVIPKSIIEKLGLESNDREGLLIEAGKYQIIDEEESYDIVLIEL
ncbi:MAG: hypothetical protein AAFO82_04415 [Bacteroidota bacterium]